MWALSDQTILKDSVDAYNKDHPTDKITLQLYANDDYKQKLRVAFGAGKAPDIFFNWGGGAGRLRQGGQDRSALTGLRGQHGPVHPSVLKSATFDGKVLRGARQRPGPVVLYYNKKVFADAGLQPPKTYSDLTAAITKLKAKGVVPLSLAANSKWPTLMYLEYPARPRGRLPGLRQDRLRRQVGPGPTRPHQGHSGPPGPGQSGPSAPTPRPWLRPGRVTALVYTARPR